MATSEMHDQFDYMVMHAAGKADLFLSIVRDRCNAADIGLLLAPRVERSGRAIMRGEMSVSSIMRGKLPFYLDVFADPQGSMLHVGYQLTSKDAPAVLNMFGSMGETAAANREILRSDPNTQRKISGTVQAFFYAAFDPTLRQLVEASGAPVPANGFLGA